MTDRHLMEAILAQNQQILDQNQLILEQLCAPTLLQFERKP